MWLLSSLIVVGPARVDAYEAARTHAGMSEAAAAGELGSWLESAWGLDRGLWTKLKLSLRSVPIQRRWFLTQDLFRLDPAGGYAPSARLVNRAMGWFVAGSVLEAIPPARIRNHFLDPSTLKGLHQRRGHRALSIKLRWWDYVFGGGSFAGFVTGANFDLDGMSAVAWLRSKRNEYGLIKHWEYRKWAVMASSAKVRAHAEAMSLLTMGAIVHVLQDMACPSHVHNDFIASHLGRTNGAMPGSPYERFVARWYGRYAVATMSVASVERSRFEDFFVGKDGKGLAQVTARQFLSPGCLPAPFFVGDTSTVETVERMLTKRRFLVAHRPLELDRARRGPVYLRRVKQPRDRVAAYEVDRRGFLRFWFDRRVLRDYARRLVPLAIAYTKGMIRYLTRGRLRLRMDRGKMAVINAGVTLSRGELVVLIEDRQGRRTVLKTVAVTHPVPKGAQLTIFSLRRPRPLAVVFEGRDSGGHHLVAEGRR